jgi:hypothetical protein
MSIYVAGAAFGGFALGVFYSLLVWHYFGPDRERRRH